MRKTNITELLLLTAYWTFILSMVTGVIAGITNNPLVFKVFIGLNLAWVMAAIAAALVEEDDGRF